MECKYSYRFTEKAEQDFDEILHYISVDLANPIAAQDLGIKMFEQIDMVRAFHESVRPLITNFYRTKPFASCQ